MRRNIQESVECRDMGVKLNYYRCDEIRGISVEKLSPI